MPVGFFRSLQSLLTSFGLFWLCTFPSLRRLALFFSFLLSKLCQSLLCLQGRWVRNGWWIFLGVLVIVCRCVRGVGGHEIRTSWLKGSFLFLRLHLLHLWSEVYAKNCIWIKFMLHWQSRRLWLICCIAVAICSSWLRFSTLSLGAYFLRLGILVDKL